MTIKVTAGRWAQRWLSQTEAASINSDSGLTAIEAVKLAGIPEEEIGPLELNGKIVPPNTALNDGDELLCHPCIIGG